MKSKLILRFVLTLAIAFAPSLHAKEKNLVKNGGFSSKNIEPWHLGITQKYGEKAPYKTQKHAIHFTDLKPLNLKYLTLSQYIEIKSGTSYQVTFDAQIAKDTEGKITMAVGRPGYARPRQKSDQYDHLKPVTFIPETEWKTFTYTFSGVYKTDNKDAKKKGTKELKKKWKAIGTNTDPGVAPSWIIFNLGAIKGELSLRNVNIVEVKK